MDSLKTLAIKKQHTRISLVGLTYPGQDAGEVYNLEPSPETDRKKLQKKPVPSGHRTRETVAEWQKTFLAIHTLLLVGYIHGITESQTQLSD